MKLNKTPLWLGVTISAAIGIFITFVSWLVFVPLIRRWVEIRSSYGTQEVDWKQMIKDMYHGKGTTTQIQASPNAEGTNQVNTDPANSVDMKEKSVEEVPEQKSETVVDVPGKKNIFIALSNIKIKLMKRKRLFNQLDGDKSYTLKFKFYLNSMKKSS